LLLNLDVELIGERGALKKAIVREVKELSAIASADRG